MGAQQHATTSSSWFAPSWGRRTHYPVVRFVFARSRVRKRGKHGAAALPRSRSYRYGVRCVVGEGPGAGAEGAAEPVRGAGVAFGSRPPLARLGVSPTGHSGSGQWSF